MDSETAKLAKQTHGKASRSKGPCITSWLRGSRNAVIRKALSASLSDGAGIEPKECLARLAGFHGERKVRTTAVPGSAMRLKKGAVFLSVAEKEASDGLALFASDQNDFTHTRKRCEERLPIQAKS